MKILEMMGLVGIGYILKDSGMMYPRYRRSYSAYANSKASPGERIRKTLGNKLADVLDRVLVGIKSSGYEIHDVKPSYIEHSKTSSKKEPEHEFINEITYSEFLNEHNNYLKETIAIYKDYIVDENYGCLMEHPEQLIGKENCRRICENMSYYDWGTYYIRNDELETDFEVNIYNENYADMFGAKKPEKHEVKIESLERNKEDFE